VSDILTILTGEIDRYLRLKSACAQ
jgi:hypothetical protein